MLDGVRMKVYGWRWFRLAVLSLLFYIFLSSLFFQSLFNSDKINFSPLSSHFSFPSTILFLISWNILWRE